MDIWKFVLKLATIFARVSICLCVLKKAANWPKSGNHDRIKSWAQFWHNNSLKYDNFDRIQQFTLLYKELSKILQFCSFFVEIEIWEFATLWGSVPENFLPTLIQLLNVLTKLHEKLQDKWQKKVTSFMAIIFHLAELLKVSTSAPSQNLVKEMPSIFKGRAKRIFHEKPRVWLNTEFF